MEAATRLIEEGADVNALVRALQASNGVSASTPIPNRGASCALRVWSVLPAPPDETGGAIQSGAWLKRQCERQLGA